MATQPERIAGLEQRVKGQEERCERTTKRFGGRLDDIVQAIQGNGGDTPGGLRADVLVLHAMLREDLTRRARQQAWMVRLLIGTWLTVLGTVCWFVAKAYM